MSSGRVKQAGFSAGAVVAEGAGVCRSCAFFGVQPGASGTMGLVMPSAVAVVDAADGAGEVDDAVRLAALEHGEADQRPAVGEVAGERLCSWTKSGSR